MQPQVFLKSLVRPLSISALLVTFSCITLLTSEDFTAMSTVSIILTLAWLLVGLPILLSWGVLLTDDEIIVGHRLPAGKFRKMRSLYWTDIGRVAENGLGDIVLFGTTQNTYPGRREVVLSRDIRGLDRLVGHVLQKIAPDRVDDGVRRRFLSGG